MIKVHWNYNEGAILEYSTTYLHNPFCSMRQVETKEPIPN